MLLGGESRSEHDGGTAGSAHSDLSKVGPVGEKINVGADADRVGAWFGVDIVGGELVIGGEEALVAVRCLIFVRLCS